jgi:predicted metal-dependent peptidase
MSLTSDEVKKYTQKLLLSRFRILNRHGFYGLLLMHMRFGLDEACDTAYTDGYRINFSPVFLESLSNDEVDFVLMHEILHVVLKHCFRGRKVDPYLFNIACDIVVNSNILYSKNMNLKYITLEKYGESMHLAPNGKEGYLYTAEEVYNMLIKDSLAKNSGKSVKGDSFDDHSHWEEADDDFTIDEWEKRVIDAAESSAKRDTSVGNIPLGVQRYISSLKNATIDWRMLLNDFISLEVGDYSFTPPDRRMDGPFFMPDFNELVEKEDDPKEILFMIDTSGSVNSNQITQAYSEIKGALEQFTSLTGYLGFFDYVVYEPQEFSSIEDILEIIPKGGGGTNFFAVFEYVNNLENKPKAIIILTDGYATFPKESVRNGIPVIWVMNNDKVTPPWGEVARMK